MGEENAQTRSICEGSAEILSNGHVFYNPVQEFNRDLSISVITTYLKKFHKENNKNKIKNNIDEPEDNLEIGKRHNDGLRILEALSATGLRSIRYAKEISGIKEIIANDLSKSAVESIELNIKHNNVQNLVTASHADAMALMYSSTTADKRFNVVDLDPYGCPNRFLDGAIQSIADGGLLLITATDMAVLAGNTPEACYVKYGSVPLKMKSCHEMALRILLRCVEGHANVYGKYIEPLLSISADFYIRVFVRVFTSQLICKQSMSKQSMIYQCTGCSTFTLQPLGILKENQTTNNKPQIKYSIPTGPYVGTNCIHCGQRHHLGGPIWSAPMHNLKFVQDILEIMNTNLSNSLTTSRRIIGMLSVVEEELSDVPLYYSLDKMCSVLKLEIMPMLKFRSAILNAGYRVSYSHAFKNSVKTDAPPTLLWDILRCWAKIHPVKPERLLEGTPITKILGKEPETECNINDIHPLANPKSRKDALARFPENPTTHWGPGTRSTLMIGEDKILKSYRNQNKKQKHKQIEEIHPEDKKMKLK